LKSLRDLPHVGGIVEAHENERVERLMRIVRHIIDERQQTLAAYDSIEEFNKENPKEAFPAVLVAIDNVSDFKETYEEHLMDLVNLVRDGRTFGVYFVITGAIYGDVPNRLFNVLNQRITFAQIDPSDYSMIVGRGWTTINNVPGRGLTVEQIENSPQPLEFHTAVPAGEPDGGHYRQLAKVMNEAWQSMVEKDESLLKRQASTVEVLSDAIALKKVLPELGSGKAPVAVPIGVNDLDRESTLIEFENKGPHLIVIGPPMTGKTTTLRSLTLALAHCYTPSELAMVLIDPSDPARRFFQYGAGEGSSLADLPHVLGTASTSEEMDEVVMRLHAEYDDDVRKALKDKSNGFNPANGDNRRIVVLIDHYDDADMLNQADLGLQALAEVGKGKDIHFVIAGSTDITRDSMDQLRRRAESNRYTLVLQDYETVRYMGVRGDLTGDAELPPGRGFLVKAIKASMTQICLPVAEGVSGISEDEALEELIGSIKKKYRKAAEWSYSGKDLGAIEELLDFDGLGGGMDMDMGADLGELEALLAEQEAEMEEDGADVSASEVDSMKKSELEDLAEKMGVTPSEGSGSGGSVLVDDLKEAIKAAL
jgi:S-DNA-T family DNA segregation ATPase FtsK/SpoIIIE